MKTQITIISCWILLSSIISCNKVDNLIDNIITDSTVTPNDSNYLKMILEIDTLQYSYDTTKTNFYYDNKKRLNHIETVKPHSNYFWNIDISYTGDNIKATGYKLSFFDYVSGGITMYIHHYSYNTSGLLEKDSIENITTQGNNGSWIDRYVYTSTYVQRYFYPSPSSVDYLFTVKAYKGFNNNFQAYNTLSSNSYVDSTTLFFDSKNSPFFRFRFALPLYLYSIDYYPNFFLFQNNVVKEFRYQFPVTGNPPPIPITNYLYQYNNNGYPILKYSIEEDLYTRFYYQSL